MSRDQLSPLPFEQPAPRPPRRAAARRLCDACTVGNHSRCTGVACRSCPDPYHRPVGVACPTADPWGEMR